MQPISSFNSNLGTAILILGPAGSGKTSLGMRLFPKTYVFVADLNFDSGKRYLQKLGQLDNVVGFDTASVDETGMVVSPQMRFDRMLKCIGVAHKDPNVDCVFLDSATFIEDILKARICGAINEGAINLKGYDQWGQLILVWKSLIMQCRQSGKKLILSAHQKKEKDESDQIFKYQIAVDGKIQSMLPALFSDVWRCEITENQQKYQWMLRPLGNARQEDLKNTYGMTGLLPQDDVVKLVRATL